MMVSRHFDDERVAAFRRFGVDSRVSFDRFGAISLSPGLVLVTLLGRMN